MIEEVEENLGITAQETVADGGYYSPEQLLQADEKKMDVLVNISKNISPKDEKNKFHKSKFIYDEKKDVFVCPMKKELRFAGKQKSKSGKYIERIYRCKSFKDCPVRWECSKAKNGKKIKMGPHYMAIIRRLDKQKIPGKKEQLAKRMSIVEKTFGSIKEILKFRRFTVRGLEKVRAQWSLICTTFNLRKLFKIWADGKLVIA